MEGVPFHQFDNIHILVSEFHLVVEILFKIIEYYVAALPGVVEFRLESQFIPLEFVFIIKAQMPAIPADVLDAIIKEIGFAQDDGGEVTDLGIVAAGLKTK